VSNSSKAGADKLQTTNSASSHLQHASAIKLTSTVFHRKIIPKELAYPRPLRNHGKPLVEEELKTEVIRSDSEGVSPRVGLPMSSHAHKQGASDDAAPQPC
jgi:hypothetical protein